jgi:tRNA (mo5U34)-methyltransferase
VCERRPPPLIVRGMNSDTDAIRERVDAIRWYHTIDLGNGLRTPGVYDPSAKLDRYRLPDDLTGKTVCDIGAWDGFFSFEAERRGAARVLATDSFVWRGATWGSKAGFELAREVKGSKVEDKTIDVLDLSPDTVGTFDLVLFLGVLYHMRYPMLAVDRVASICSEQLVLETHVDLVHLRRPAMGLYGGRELDDDPTNWCGPNPAAVTLLLRRAGFTRVEVMPPAGRVYNVAKYAATRVLRRGHRMVFHAFR